MENGVKLPPALRAAIREHRMLFVQISVISFALGCIGVACVSCMIYDGWLSTATTTEPSGAPFRFAIAAYVLFCSVLFHMSEFLVAARYRPHDTHPKAFMLYHSDAYMAAQLAALVEFVVEAWLVPDGWKWFQLSTSSVLVASFAVLVLYGVRISAMVTCGENFSLEIEESHRPDHRLVTNGIFAYLRHPAYFGWFWRTVFSQVILMNPMCFVAFTLVTWKFFKQRIPHEEALLSSDDFFGETYTSYKKRTPTGIPFIE